MDSKAGIEPPSSASKNRLWNCGWWSNINVNADLLIISTINEHSRRKCLNSLRLSSLEAHKLGGSPPIRHEVSKRTESNDWVAE